uniref:Beaded filament structural protein 2, phakinin n=1 Tax=Oryzias latipes TaxID=8090 RepID=A0A3P9L073_ORYLA
MPLPRRRSSILGQTSTERPAPASCGRMGAAGTAAPRGVFVGPAPAVGVASGLGTRVSRRALGISSVFLQGMRSSTVPVLPQTGQRAGGQGAGALNSCLMEYREKVRALEQLNQQLEQQIRLCLDRRASSAGTWGPLRREWEEVYRQVSEAILDNARLMLQTENVQASAEDFKERFESEQPLRSAMEEEISSLHRVIQEARVTKAELEEQMEMMRQELRTLEQNHEQDVRALYHQMEGREVDEPDAPIETSLDQILANIRSHWEKVTEKNRVEADNYQESKEAPCTSSRLSPEEEQVEALKAECSETGCKIQSLQAETESIRALVRHRDVCVGGEGGGYQSPEFSQMTPAPVLLQKRGLESSLTDARHWHQLELQNLGSVVSKLEAELADVREEIEQQRRDYDTLLSNKQKLEQEIGLYHGILDGEENRFQPTATTQCTAPNAECEGATPAPPEQ